MTGPWDANVDSSHNYKQEKYAPLVANLSCNFAVYQFSVEVSVRGQISNKERLKAFIYRCCVSPGKLARCVITNSSKASLLSSYQFFVRVRSLHGKVLLL